MCSTAASWTELGYERYKAVNELFKHKPIKHFRENFQSLKKINLLNKKFDIVFDARGNFKGKTQFYKR